MPKSTGAILAKMPMTSEILHSFAELQALMPNQGLQYSDSAGNIQAMQSVAENYDRRNRNRDEISKTCPKKTIKNRGL